MSYEVEKQTNTEATLKITLSADELKPLYDHTLGKMRHKVKAAGFRPGKAPDNIVEKELGSSAVQSEVLQEATMHSYVDAVQELKLPVIASPQVTLQKFVPYTELEFTAQVVLMPPVTLPDYKKVKVKRPEVKVEDAEVEATLEQLRSQMAKNQGEGDKAPELNDEFAAKLGPYKSLAELKADLGKHVLAQKTQQAKHEFEHLILEELLKTSKIELPAVLVEQQLAGLKAQQPTGEGAPEPKDDKVLKAEAERRVALAMVLTEIAKAEQLKVSEPELDAELARLREHYQEPSMKAELNHPSVREELYNHLLSQKTIDKIVEYAEQTNAA